MAPKHRKAAIALTQAQNPASGMLDHARGREHHRLHHRLDTPTFCSMTHEGIWLIERFLPNQVLNATQN